MGIIATDKKQITLIFDPSTKLGRECRAYAESAQARIQTIDVNKTKIADTEWADIADRLGMKVTDLIATDHPTFTTIYGENVKLDEEHAFKILDKNPQCIVYPIALRGDRAVRAKSFADILDLIDPDTGEVPIP
ncbi:arsenate reductase family protein [Robertkochia aurantiaca]|uniref:arsenate reductase family protein n=1 Tax=Robertkochia aurantiaca TaxID=2873700 RepID=UPI001CCAB2E5|nr:hypothetical protein [Robertkochia sp. 3YJGBD-33]